MPNKIVHPSNCIVPTTSKGIVLGFSLTRWKLTFRDANRVSYEISVRAKCLEAAIAAAAQSVEPYRAIYFDEVISRWVETSEFAIPRAIGLLGEGGRSDRWGERHG